MTSVAACMAEPVDFEESYPGASEANESIKVIAKEVLSHWQLPAVRGWKHSLKFSIRKSQAECQDINWDGYGALPIREEAVTRAFQLLKCLPDYIVEPDVVCEPNGDIGFSWHGRRGYAFSMSHLEGGVVSFASLFGHNDRLNGSFELDKKIPQRVLERIQEITATAE